MTTFEQYLMTFQRLAMAYRWPREDWAVFIVPYLAGKARSAYVAMNMGHATDPLGKAAFL